MVPLIYICADVPGCMQMFVFGTKALEQFVDRLIEWPQYCNHILQISHLRNTHSDLVAFIERTLARISSSHSDPDGGNIPASVHHGPPQGGAANMEVRTMFVFWHVACIDALKT